MGQTSLSELPPEILEHILSSLSPVDIVRMKEVNRPFLNLISNSQYLQHRIDLFGAGLIDNPDVPCSLAERRARLCKYVDGWNNPETSVRYDCLLRNRTSALCSYPVGHDLFLAREDDPSPVVCFTRIPSSPSQGTAEEWTLEFPFPISNCLVSSRDNLLAVIEHGSTNIHLFNLLDGSPHEVPLQKVLSLNSGYGFPLRALQQISGCRIALVAQTMDYREELNTTLIAWDWRTGAVVLERSSYDPGIGDATSNISAVRFFDESWLVALSRRSSNPHLLVFNTLLPQQDPKSWKILQLPRLPQDMNYIIPAQYGNSSVEFPEFSMDPAERNFIVSTSRGLSLVIPVGLFIRVTSSVRASPRIPWDDWGEGILRIHHPDAMFLQVVGTKALALCGLYFVPRNWSVRMYDLRKLCRKETQNKPVGEGYERTLLTPKWSARCEMGDILPNEKFLIGNKVVCFYSQELPSAGNDFLRVWKIG